jgi:coniferyl-aldehyde dehydrogenase
MSDTNTSSMKEILERQKAGSIREPFPSAEQRIERLDKSIDLLLTHRDALCDAMRDDFGHRSPDVSLAFDVSGSIDALKHAKKHLRKWMRPEKRSPQFPLGLFGAKAVVRYQPKGVVGIISPWNFPVNLAFSPLAGVLAAGNRAMIKPSEFTEKTSALMAELIGQYYEEDEVAVVTGGPEIGAAFSELPFDHLVFTGATSVARHVMRARTGRQVAGRSRGIRRHRESRAANDDLQDPECRADLPGTGLRIAARRQGRRICRCRKKCGGDDVPVRRHAQRRLHGRYQ